MVIATLLLLTQLSVQQPSAFEFDYLDADLTTGSVTRFEMQIDDGAWGSIGIPTDTAPISGGRTYRVPVPALVPGDHTVRIRACNVDVCSTAAVLTFRLIVMPVAPTNLRIRG